MFDKYVTLSMTNLIVIERMFILNCCCSNGFVMSFLKENVQVKYLMDFSKERVLIIKMSQMMNWDMSVLTSWQHITYSLSLTHYYFYEKNNLGLWKTRGVVNMILAP